VELLLPTDAVDATGGEGANANKQAQKLVERDAWLKAQLEEIQLSVQQGNSTFQSTTGRVITHNLGHTNYLPHVVATADPGGALGEVWFTLAANTFTVFNSGTWTGAFRWALSVGQ
jgi:hypothetical protein